MYAKYFKRVIDFSLSLIALIVLSPLLLVLIVTGTVFMKGNPFFTQERPGKDEKIFKLIKFRTMDNRKNREGKLLPDEVRLNKYGRFLRATSLDELPELANIVKGDMRIVGPRPLAVIYLEYYNDEEKKRHTVLPGLTGFAYDIQYVENVSFLLDVKIILKTIVKVFKRQDVSVRGTTQIKDFHVFRMEEWEKEKQKGGTDK